MRTWCTETVHKQQHEQEANKLQIGAIGCQFMHTIMYRLLRLCRGAMFTKKAFWVFNQGGRPRGRPSFSRLHKREMGVYVANNAGKWS